MLPSRLEDSERAPRSYKCFKKQPVCRSLVSFVLVFGAVDTFNFIVGSRNDVLDSRDHVQRIFLNLSSN